MSTWFFLDFAAQFSCVKNNMSSLFSRCGWSKATPKLVSPRYVKNPTQLTLASVEYDGTWSFGRNHSEAVSPKNNLGDLVEFCVSIVGSTYQIRTQILLWRMKCGRPLRKSNEKKTKKTEIWLGFCAHPWTVNHLQNRFCVECWDFFVVTSWYMFQGKSSLFQLYGVSPGLLEWLIEEGVQITWNVTSHPCLFLRFRRWGTLLVKKKKRAQTKTHDNFPNHFCETQTPQIFPKMCFKKKQFWKDFVVGLLPPCNPNPWEQTGLPTHRFHPVPGGGSWFLEPTDTLGQCLGVSIGGWGKNSETQWFREVLKKTSTNKCFTSWGW